MKNKQKGCQVCKGTCLLVGKINNQYQNCFEQKSKGHSVFWKTTKIPTPKFDQLRQFFLEKRKKIKHSSRICRHVLAKVVFESCTKVLTRDRKSPKKSNEQVGRDNRQHTIYLLTADKNLIVKLSLDFLLKVFCRMQIL